MALPIFAPIRDRWPKGADDTYIVSSLKSPYRNDVTGEFCLDVGFISEDGKASFSLKLPWDILSEFWVGRIFHSYKPQYARLDSAVIRIPLFGIHDSQLCTFRELGTTFGQDPDEYGVIFNFNNEQYIVSCLEIVRGYFSFSRKLTQQLLRCDGIENLVAFDTWKELKDKSTNGKLYCEFDYNDALEKNNPEKLALRIAEIYKTKKLNFITKRILQHYRRNEKIITELPTMEGGMLLVSDIFFWNGYNFIGRICPYLPVVFEGNERVIPRVTNTIVFDEKPCLCFSRNDIYFDICHEYNEQTGRRYTMNKDNWAYIKKWLATHEESEYFNRYVPLYENQLIPYVVKNICEYK